MKRDKISKSTPVWKGEPKQAVKLSLTQTAWQSLERQAQKLGISPSELVERYARNAHCSYCARGQVDCSNSRTSASPLTARTLGTDCSREYWVAEATTNLNYATRVADRTARLQSVTAALSEALTPVDVATVIMEQALAALGACRGLVALLKADRKELELIRAVGYAPNTLSRWHSFPVTANVPLAHVVRTQTPVFLQSLDEMIALYPPLAPLKATIPAGAIAIIPLIAKNQVLGSLSLGFTEAHQISKEDQEFILTLAHQCAQAIQRAQLYQGEQTARANAEASEQRFRCMAESIPQMVWVAQANGFTEYYNQRWFQYTGLTLEESQNANGSFRHPEDHDRFKAAWIEASTNRQVFQAEQRIKRADGTYRWHLTRAYPLLDENGEIVKWFGSCTDIDDWKRMEQTQRFLAQASQTFAAANLNLQAVLDNITQLTSELTGDVCSLNLLSENKQWLNLASCYHADPTVREFSDDLVKWFACRTDEGIGGRVVQTGEPLLMAVTSQEELGAAIKPEYRLYLERFPIRSILLLPLKAQGQMLGVLMFARHAPADPHTQDDLNLFQDLAARAAMAIANAQLYRQAEQARQQAEKTAERNARLQSITAILSEQLTPAQVAAVIVEQSQAVLNADAALVAIVCENGTDLEIVHALGYQQDLVEQWRRFPISIAAPMTDAMRTGEVIWESSIEERAARYPHIAKAYARYNFTAWMSLPLMVEGRAVGGITLSFIEAASLQEEDRAFFLALTQQCAQAIARTQLYEAEQRARAQAEAANRLKDEFLAVLSHELRTPMNPILGWATLLKQGNLDVNKRLKAIETIERNAKLQVQLIEDLLDISRILQGKLSLAPHPVSLVTTIEAAMETVHLAASAKGIEVRFTVEEVTVEEVTVEEDREIGLSSTSSPSALPIQVLGDVGRLQQVVWNLLSNAVKFTPEQGQIEIRLSTIGTQAQIQVKDTGKGISSEFLPYVFETFRQADSSITRTFGGLGLGLAIARHIVELHGGTIQVESSGEGQGATFTVTLPLHQAERGPDELLTLSLHEPAPSTPLVGIKVLVVDDEIDNLELATFILEQAGAAVATVASAQEALQSLSQTKPDILLADIGMPQMDGYTLLQQIRALPAEHGGTIPAIALTAYAGEVDQQQALAVGFQMHLSKPVEPDHLISMIASLVAH
ncbi:MAG TPA: GAF domain-containing protein [Candidatus Obscuribacterales bacterium]